MRGKLLFSFFVCTVLAAVVYGQAPVASISALDPTSACPSFAVRFVGANSGGAATTITWNYSGTAPDVIGPISGVMTPTAIFNTPGTYVVTMVLTNASGSSTSNPITVTVKNVPIVDFNAGTTIGCFPFPVTFNNLSSPLPGSTFSWDFGDGSVSTAISPTHTYNLVGNYAVTLTVTNSLGCSASKTNTGYIQVPSGVIPNFSDSLSSSCTPPTTVYFNNQSVFGGTATFIWDFGDGQTSNATSPSHIYAAAGNYPVKLTVQSNLGCTDSYTDNLNISASGANSKFSAPDSICVGLPASFTNTSSPNPNTSTWKFGDGATATGSPASHAYSALGTYTVTLINQFSSCSDSATKLIHVINPPAANFSAVTTTNSCQFPFTVSFQDMSPGSSNWQWDFGDGSTGTGPNPSHTYTSYGQFTVTLSSSTTSGCTNIVTKPNFIKVVKPTITANLPAYGCAPYSFTLLPNYLAVDGIASYSWDMGNGNTYTVANPPVQNYGPGIYKITGSITTTGGCTATIVDTIKVGTTKPVANFSANPVSACVGQKIQFNDLSTGSPDQWFWSFGDGSTWTSKIQCIAYTTPGTYSVKLIAYNNGCADSITKSNYIIVQPPLAKFSYSYNCTNTSQVYIP